MGHCLVPCEVRGKKKKDPRDPKSGTMVSAEGCLKGRKKKTSPRGVSERLGCTEDSRRLSRKFKPYQRGKKRVRRQVVKLKNGPGVEGGGRERERGRI